MYTLTNKNRDTPNGAIKNILVQNILLKIKNEEITNYYLISFIRKT